MEGLELVCFSIISSVGAAKSFYVEALNCAKAGNYEEASAKILEGDALFVEGHKTHMELIQKECAGEEVKGTLLLMHAEDQLISTETLKLMILEMIELYKKVA